MAIKCPHYPQCQLVTLRHDMPKHLEECKFQTIRCSKECALNLPRGKVHSPEHNCARELRNVLDNLLRENEVLKLDK
jgi:hypothetical protein